jgi:hypothetical protein
MLKRILLFGGTLLVVGIGLAFYYQANREYRKDPARSFDSATDLPIVAPPSSTMDLIPVDAGAAIGTVKGTRIQSRSLEGQLESELGFSERLGQRQGQLEFSHPWVVFYDWDNDTVTLVTADTLSTPVDITGKLPEVGNMTGGVMIQMLPLNALAKNGKKRPASYSNELYKEAIWVAEMDHVQFQLELSLLTSPSRTKNILIRGDGFRVQGRQLTMQYDQVRRKLQELELRELDYIEVDADLYEQRRPEAKAEELTAKEKKDEALKELERRSYLMTLTQDVEILQKNQRCHADVLEILVNTNRSRTKKPSPDAESIASDSDSKESSESPSDSSEGSPEEQSDTVRLTCRGPMRIVPAEDIRPMTLDSPLEVTLTGSPVRLWRNEEEISQSRQITYDHSTQIVRFRPQAGKPVQFNLSNTRKATAQKEMRIDLKSAIATFEGPGRFITNSQAGDNPVEIDYGGQVRFRFLNADPNVQLEWLDYTGGLQANFPDGHFEANQGRLEFFTMQEYRQASIAMGEPNNPQIKAFQFDGEIKVTTNKNESFVADSISGDFSLAKNGSAAPDMFRTEGYTFLDTPDNQLETTDRVNLIFDSDKIAHSLGITDDDTKSHDTATWISEEYLHSVLAEGKGNGVKMTWKENGFQGTGDKLEGQLDTERWTFSGNPTRTFSLDPNDSFRAMEGSVIVADLRKEYFEIPGAGKLTAFVDKDLTGRNRSKSDAPFPAEVAWDNGAAFYPTDRLVVVNDAWVTVEEDKLPKTRCTRMHSPMLTIALAQPFQNQLEDANSTSPFDEITSFTAAGPSVEITSEEFKTGTQQHLSLMTLKSRALDYDFKNQQMTAFGEGTAELRQFEKALENSDSASQSMERTFNRSLSDQGPSTTLLSYDEYLKYDSAKNNIRIEGNVKLHQVPVIDNIPTDATGTPHVEGMKLFFCHSLRCAFVDDSPSAKKASVTPDAGGGLQQVRDVMAEGDVVFVTVFKDERRTFFSDSLTYNNETGNIVLSGTPETPVISDELKCLEATYNMHTGAFVIDTPLGQSQIALQP